VEVEAFHFFARLEFVIEVTPCGDHLAPAECVADAGDSLPCEAGLARPDIEVVTAEPVIDRAEIELSLDADDAVPVLELCLARALLRRAHERAEAGAERVVEGSFDIEKAPASD